MFFRDIEGNKSVKQQLLHAVDSNRLGHAILFAGQEGDAKLQLAIALSAYLNCSSRHDGDACGECPSCKQIKRLAHPELHFVFPFSASLKKKSSSKDVSSNDFLDDWRNFVIRTNGMGSLSDWYREIGLASGQGIISANDCNNVIKELSYTSYESKYKVVIIWMVEKLFYAAAPKLLKILEEPPQDSLFILITENKDAILDTILSRSQTLNIPEFTREDVKEILVKKYQVDELEASKIADMSNGNAAMALSIANEPNYTANLFDEFIQWMRICLQADMLKILPFVDSFSKNSKEYILFFLRSSLSLLQQALFFNQTKVVKASIADNQKETFAKFAKFVTVDNINIFNESINKTIYAIERNGNMALLLTNLTIGLCRAFKIK